jgi:hypothetical protein
MHGHERRVSEVSSSSAPFFARARTVARAQVASLHIERLVAATLDDDAPGEVGFGLGRAGAVLVGVAFVVPRLLAQAVVLGGAMAAGLVRDDGASDQSVAAVRQSARVRVGVAQEQRQLVVAGVALGVDLALAAGKGGLNEVNEAALSLTHVLAEVLSASLVEEGHGVGGDAVGEKSG